MTAQRRWPTALAGTLEHVGISSVLTLLEMERRTGMLELRRGRRAGLIAVREGRIVRASVGGNALPSCEAVSQFLGWTRGRFTFRVGEIERPEEATPTTSALLLEIARRADERARLVA
jgi:two-component system OmpR family response regulator